MPPRLASSDGSLYMRGVFDPPDREYKAYIFDCDGTLADSMPLHHRAWQIALKAHGAPFEFDWELFHSRAGMTGALTVVELSKQFDYPMDAATVAARQHSEFKRLIDAVRPIEQVVRFARDKQTAGCMLSVASGGERQAVEHTLQLIGVTDLFPVVVVSADVPRGKPHPELFLLAAERMGVAPEECAVFEDSLLGIEAARRANMGAVLVQRTAAPNRLHTQIPQPDATG